jgi:hypothetical protein
VKSEGRTVVVKVIFVTKEDYEAIVRFEDEGGAPVDVIYVIVEKDDPEMPTAVVQALQAA